MNHTTLLPPTNLLECVDCRDTLDRLIGNVSGFVYRRRLDPQWTMEFVSEGCRDVTGYDPHRFVGNASLAFGDLVAPSYREHVNERIGVAVRLRRQVTLQYLIRAAHGAWVKVEDRLTPIVNAAGKVLGLEGIIDFSREAAAPASPAPTRPPPTTNHHE